MTALYSRVGKRAFDLIGGACATVAFLPLGAAIAALVCATDRKASPFFVQERLGLGRRPFRVRKFRTMIDGRVTPMGRWLRPTGLDELPQLLCILAGEMSLVGPRPLTQADVDRLGWNGPECDGRWSTRPGLTGPAQVLGEPGAAATLARDLAYARRPRLAGDALWLAATLLINAFGKSRVRRRAGGWLKRAVDAPAKHQKFDSIASRLG